MKKEVLYLLIIMVLLMLSWIVSILVLIFLGSSYALFLLISLYLVGCFFIVVFYLRIQHNIDRKPSIISRDFENNIKIPFFEELYKIREILESNNQPKDKLENSAEYGKLKELLEENRKDIKDIKDMHHELVGVIKKLLEFQRDQITLFKNSTVKK